MNQQRHLDLGCGLSPRNPYACEELFGIDLLDLGSAEGFHYSKVNVITEPLPFRDSFFDSVSAFDFLEHVPRIMQDKNGAPYSPFIGLMNEIWRVLKPSALFYALTPCYPHPSAFVDPTHVNIITDESHTYFCGAKPNAAIYGFRGAFEELRAGLVIHEYAQTARKLTLAESARQALRRSRGRLSHVLWELRAVK